MTVLVIDVFEPVEVEKHDGQMAFLPAGALGGLFQKTVQKPRIIQLCEVVCHGEVLRLLEQDGVLEGYGSGLHHRQQQVHVPAGEPIPRRAVHDLDDADDTTSRRQRRTQDRTRLKPGELVETVLKPCVVLDVVHDRRLARTRRGSRIEFAVETMSPST